METTLAVKGMHCNSCKLLIEDAVSGIAGVTHVHANFKTGVVNVTHTTDAVLPTIKQVIRLEGYSID